MNDWPSDIKSFFWWLATAAMSFVTWLGYRQLKRLDVLEANYVSKADFEARLSKLEAAQLRQHEENLERFSGVSDDVRDFRDHIDRRFDAITQIQARPYR